MLELLGTQATYLPRSANLGYEKQRLSIFQPFIEKESAGNPGIFGDPTVNWRQQGKSFIEQLRILVVRFSVSAFGDFALVEKVKRVRLQEALVRLAGFPSRRVDTSVKVDSLRGWMTPISPRPAAGMSMVKALQEWPGSLLDVSPSQAAVRKRGKQARATCSTCW